MKRFKAAFLVVLLSLIVVRYISADERLKFQAKPHQAKRRLLAVPGSGIADLDDDDQSEATIQESLEELTEAIHKPYAPPDSSSKPTKDRKEEMLQKPVRKTKKDDSPKAALNKILTDIERNAEKEGVEVGLELASNIGQNLKKGDLRGAVGAVKETLMSAPEIGNKIITPVEADLPNILRNTNWRKLWKKRRRRLNSIPGSGMPESSNVNLEGVTEVDVHNQAPVASFPFQLKSSTPLRFKRTSSSTEKKGRKGGLGSSVATGLAAGASVAVGATVAIGAVGSGVQRGVCTPRTGTEFIELGEKSLTRSKMNAHENPEGQLLRFQKKSTFVGVIAAVGGAALAGYGSLKLLNRGSSTPKNCQYAVSQSWADVEACQACYFIWDSVKNNVDPPYRKEDISTQFDELCSSPTDIFAAPCEEMRKQSSMMIEDFSQNFDVRFTCRCAHMFPCSSNAMATNNKKLQGYV